MTHNYLTYSIEHLRTLKKDEDQSFFHPLYIVKRQGKVKEVFRDTTPLSFIAKKNYSTNWAKECRETFYKLPKIPEPFTLTDFQKKHNLSRERARKILNNNPLVFIKIDRWYYVEDFAVKPALFRVFFNSEKKRSLITAINKIREFPMNLKPTKENIADTISLHHFQVLREHQLLKSIRIPRTFQFYYFVPSFLY